MSFGDEMNRDFENKCQQRQQVQFNDARKK